MARGGSTPNVRDAAITGLWGNCRLLETARLESPSRPLRAAWACVFPCLFAAMSRVGHRYGMDLLMVVGHIADQDLGKPVDLSYDTIDLTVFRVADRDFGQGSREEMTGRA